MKLPRLFRLKKKPKLINENKILQCYLDIRDLCEKLDDTLFNLSSVKIDHEIFSNQSLDFARKSQFGLTSLRDTLKLAIEEERRVKLKKFLENQGKPVRYGEMNEKDKQKESKNESLRERPHLVN